MSDLFRSKFDKRSRVNVAIDLLINSTKGITISDDVRYTGGTNVGVMFWIDPVTLAGDCITKGVTTLTVSELGLRAGDKILITINSDGTWFKNQDEQAGTIIKDWTVAGDIIIGETNNPEFTITNLIFFDAITTAEEVVFFHTEGGLLYEDLHVDALSHHPCQNAYDDGVDNVTHDVVEQYNYSKVTPLTSLHGVLDNYTDDELGLGADFDDNTTLKDFYDKVDFQDVQFELPVEPIFQDNIEIESGFEPRVRALTFNGTSQYLRVPNFNPTNELGYTFISSISLDTDRDWSDTDGYMFEKGSSTANRIRYILQFSGNGSLNAIVNPNSAGTRNNANQLSSNKINMFSFTIVPTDLIGTQDDEMQLGFNGSIIDANIIAGNTIGSFADLTGDLRIGRGTVGQGPNRYLKGFMSYLAIFKGVFTKKELIELCNNTLLKNPSIALQSKYSLELFVDFNNPFDDAGTLKFPDLSPNAHDVIAEGYTDLATLQGSLVDINDLR